MSDRLKATWFNSGPNVNLKGHKGASNYARRDEQMIRLYGAVRPKLDKPSADVEAETDVDEDHGDNVSTRMDLDEITVATSVADSTDVLDHVDVLDSIDVIKNTRGPDLSNEGSDVIIIHPGSAQLRLGLGSHLLPRMIPHIIARRLKTPSDVVIDDTDDDEAFKYEVETYAEEMEAVIKARMKAKKLRVVPNTRQLVHSFNEYSEPEEIQDHNDPAKIEWVLPEESDSAILFGHAAQLVTQYENGRQAYQFRYPVRYGKLNWDEYKSREALLSDLEALWSFALEFQDNGQTRLSVPSPRCRSRLRTRKCWTPRLRAC